jgi:hypothetical protein
MADIIISEIVIISYIFNDWLIKHIVVPLWIPIQAFQLPFLRGLYLFSYLSF